MLIKDYKYGSKERTDDRILFSNGHNTVSTLSAISLIICTNNGSNAFTTERYFNVGLINNIIASLLPMFIMQLSFQIYIRTWRFNSSTSYSDSLQDAFGGISGVIIRIMLILSLFDNICYNCYDIYVFSEPITRYFFPDSAIANNRYLHMYILNLISAFPTLFIDKFAKFVIPSFVANVCVVFVHVIMAVFAYGSIKVVI